MMFSAVNEVGTCAEFSKDLVSHDRRYILTWTIHNLLDPCQIIVAKQPYYCVGNDNVAAHDALSYVDDNPTSTTIIYCNNEQIRLRQVLAQTPRKLRPLSSNSSFRGYGTYVQR